MKAFKKLTVTAVVFSGLAVFATGFYNSMVMSDNSFMELASSVKFAKRLDEINGKVVVGRMAASTAWKSMAAMKKPAVAQKVEVKKAIPTPAKKIVKEEKKEEVAASAVAAIPEPAIKDDLDLTVSNVFFKKPLEAGQFSGSAKAVDGVIEEIYVNLPGGKYIEINTRDRMAGNVFTYEDSNTREDKSGLFYEVKPGTYMITLANDSEFPGVRIELNTGVDNQIAATENYYDNQVSWKTNEQNTNGDLAQEYKAENEDYGYKYEHEQDSYQDNASKEATTEFNFQS